ncbi:MAG: sigma-70 family RNA polymerase sigma factor [candidate division KSB1 bacterium]|nr:sigma-70 family RNA polymerase sigma factor [candidate division KSB1 bacterium]
MDKAERAAAPSDAELLAAITEKKEWALAALYDRYATVLYSLALKILSESEPAQDVVQETFLTVWRKAALYKENRGSVSTWLIVLCRNLAIDQYRSKMRLASRQIELEAASQNLLALEANPADAAAAAEDGRQLREALRQLSTEQRQMIEMAYFHGMSQSEIAAATQTPLGTVKTRTRQALLKLRDALLGSQ